MLQQFLLAILICWTSLSVVCADITVPQHFSDNMVLQRNSQTRIWGTAKPGQELSLQFDDQTLQTTADSAGNWSIVIPVGAAGGPYDLTITATQGQPQLKLSNVMVGEVWLCSGQSNMQWPVSKSLNAQTEIEQSINYPNLRLFTIHEKPSLQPLEAFEKVTGWVACSPDSVGEFSAVGYFFGRELQKRFPDVPIGLVHSSWGGTTCEAWISRPRLDSIPSLAPLLEHWTTIEGPQNRNRPAVLYNGMISPLCGLPLRGVIWYQGEANNGRGEQYATLLPTLIADWRSFFGQEELPFLFVQLAPFRYAQQSPEALAEIWDAQLKTLKTVPGTGMAVTTDIGANDDIHPMNKQEVGRRLALLALTEVYRDQLPPDQRDLVSSGPIYQSMETIGDRIRLTFAHAEGLAARGNEATLTEFTLCGADQKFVPATAVIVKGGVEVFAEGITNPVAVRFAWHDTAEPNLINGAGLPASPFRTDEFLLQSHKRNF